MPENKFNKIQDNVLYNVAKSRKKIKVKELAELMKDYVSRKQIYLALDHLSHRRLIVKYKDKRTKEDWSIIAVGLDPFSLDRVKKILGKHWENNWESDWK